MSEQILVSSYIGSAQSWTGVIKRGKEIVWQCPHFHCNRNHSSRYNRAATACSGRVLQFLNKPEIIDRCLRWYGSGAQVNGYQPSQADYEFDKWCAEQSKTLAQRLTATECRE